ncbi:AAA family ATPase [Solihabitans fulvus]|uniref:AAA family ATPase n=1 Tax=Solihabitans fulvus TaxID=1892852 RepID=A0A5B2WHV3_9PSEU|nr:BTAD domain-containing putative transcriptional regulator [Solihabitans fulvus]KAA2251411.1 AAA family ATPase [Solihabitans fulvus]
MVRVRVLGSIEAEVDGVAVPLGGPRQRAVLALLVSARGDVVSVDRLIEDLWNGEPPAQAVTSLQAYVSNLRRLLEPGRPPRTPARLLVSSPPGYALRLPEDAVDAWRFERLAREARETADPVAARATLTEALALWRGPVFAEAADEPWALAETTRLTELRLAARELRVSLGLRAGDVVHTALEAELLTREEPLREEGWRLHALALWGGDRQADALATLRRARAVLADDVGLDPGPALAAVEEAILAQRVDVLRAAVGGPTPAAPAVSAPPRAARAEDLFVGRDGELAALGAVAQEVPARGVRVALVTGEAGLGKSALLSRLAENLAEDGWLVATGRCPEDSSAPPAWAWVEALRAVSEVVPPPEESSAALAPLLSEDGPGPAVDAAVGRFRLHRAVWSWLAAAARERPTAIMLDDLHWADAETLALVAGAADHQSGAPILVVGAFRQDEVHQPLADALAALARRSPLRVALPGLPEAAVARLVHTVGEAPVDRDTVAALTERTGGNPFYLRESVRLLGSEGALVALSEVPEGVRDVLRRRLARLPEPAVAVLRLAALAGRDVDVEVLVSAADTDESGVLDAVEAGLIAGLLTEPAPGRVRFVHALVRDTMVADLSRLRSARMHARIGAALERLSPDDVSALAHHFARAATAATSVRAVDYCVRAAELAERRYAYDKSVGQLVDALASFERIPAQDGVDRDDRRAELLGALLRAQVRAGAIADARATRGRAVEFAEAAGRDDLLIAAFTAWTDPTPWQTRPYGMVDGPVVALLTRLLALPDLAARTRCRLLDVYASELSGGGLGSRARAAAEEAVALAAEVGDPALRALAMSTLMRELDIDLEGPRRAALAREVAEIGDEWDLPEYRWFGRFTQASGAAAAGDPVATRRFVEQGLELARTYQMPEAIGVGECALATLAHVEGRLEEAERRYAEATAQMIRHGSLHAAGYFQLTRASILAGAGRLAEFADRTAGLYEDYGPIVADLAAAALAAAGRLPEARAMRARAVPIRADYFYTAMATFRAIAVVALGERDAARELYGQLLPYRDAQLAGLTSMSVAMRPIAHTLGELARLLGDTDAAADHFARAEAVALRWGATEWAAQARAAAAAVVL